MDQGEIISHATKSFFVSLKEVLVPFRDYSFRTTWLRPRGCYESLGSILEHASVKIRGRPLMTTGHGYERMFSAVTGRYPFYSLMKAKLIKARPRWLLSATCNYSDHFSNILGKNRPYESTSESTWLWYSHGHEIARMRNTANRTNVAR